jgi:hypothetical protein
MRQAQPDLMPPLIALPSTPVTREWGPERCGCTLTTLYPRHATPANASLMEALPLTRLLHDNMAIVVSFVFSQASIKRLLKESLMDYWRHVENFSYVVPRRNAIRACLEIAVLIRLIDDKHKITDALEKLEIRNFGVVYRTDETTAVLSLRELTNKIIHAEDLSWDLFDEGAPKLICTSSDDQKRRFRWTRAEVDIGHLIIFCGLPVLEQL